jgi:signal transduction histidine kinase
MEENNMDISTKSENTNIRGFYRWPIRISRVFYNQSTIDPDSSCTDERKEAENTSTNLTALYSKGSVAGWMYKFLEVIKQKFGFFPPMKLVQPSYAWTKSPNFLDTSTKPCIYGDFESLELNLLYEKCSPICGELRKKDAEKAASDCDNNRHCDTCNQDEIFCEYVDNQVASFLLGETIDSLKDENKKKEIEDCWKYNIFDDNGNPRRLEVLYSKGNYYEFPYIKYYCPRTYMLEFAFPLIVDKTIIGVLIMGQLIPAYMTKTIFEQCKNCLNWEDDEQEKNRKYFELNKTCGPEREKYQYYKLTSEESDTFVLTTDKVDEFSNLFSQEAHRQSVCLQYRYEEIWNSFKQNALSAFKQDLSDFSMSHEKRNDMTESLDKQLISIAEKLSCVKQIWYYRATRKRDPKDTQLHFQSGLGFDIKEDDNGIKLNHIEEKSLKKYFLDRLSTKEIYEHLSDYSKKGNSINLMEKPEWLPHGLKSLTENSHFFMSFSLDNTPSQGFLISFEDEFYETLQIRSIDNERLQILFDTIGEEMDFCISFDEIKKSKNLYQGTSSFIAHELTQQTFTISGRINDLETSWSQIYTAKEGNDPSLRHEIEVKSKIIKDYMRDMKSVYSQMTNLSKVLLAVSHKDDNLAIGYAKKWFRSGYVRPVMESYHVKRTEKRMGIEVDDSVNDQYITSQELQLTVIIYNLISNALKYGFDGTKIYIKAEENKSSANEFKFTITDYGWAIKDADKEWIFELGTRLQYGSKNSEGRDYQDTKETGTGIGLNLVQEYLKDIGGEVTGVTSIKVSEYNLPLIKAAIAFTRKSPHKEKEKLQEYLHKAEASGLYKEIVKQHISVDRQTFREAEIDRRVMNPMYKTTFEITIPNKI